MKSITMPTPDDLHVHFRSGLRLAAVVPHTAVQFARAIVMPNLAPKHITTLSEVLTYYDEIMAAVPEGVLFTPLMTVSLSKEMTPKDLKEVLACEYVYGAKLYAGHTTNSEGVTDVQALAWAFDTLQEADKPLLVHGEAGVMVDVFDREQRFYEHEMLWIVETFPSLRIVCEHITTAYAGYFVAFAREGVAATITPQHLLVNRNDMLGKGGIIPDMYCMPVLKKEEDRLALLMHATSGNLKFFLGTDSAPHPRFGIPKKSKYSACGCAGCFTAPHALELYATAFDSVDKLYMLPDFASKFGREFYGLPPNEGSVIIEEVETRRLPAVYEFGHDSGDTVTPFDHGAPLRFLARRIP